MYVYVCVLEALMDCIWDFSPQGQTNGQKRCVCVCVCVVWCVCVCVCAREHTCIVSLCLYAHGEFFFLLQMLCVCVSYDSRCSQEGFMEQNDLLSSKLNDV